MVVVHSVTEYRERARSVCVRLFGDKMREDANGTCIRSQYGCSDRDDRGPSRAANALQTLVCPSGQECMRVRGSQLVPLLQVLRSSQGG